MISLFFLISLTLISILGLFFNGYIVIAVISIRQATSANNILLLHLGIVDVFLSILFLIFSIPRFATKTEWSMNDGAPCIIHGFLYTLFHPLALWTICGLNCDRYYAIATPLHYGHLVKQKKVLMGLGIGWIISFIFCIPPLLTVSSSYSEKPGFVSCVSNFTYGAGSLIYTTLYTAFTFLLPSTLIICCNLKILMIARYHRHRIASAIYEVTLSAQVAITHQRNPFFVPTLTATSSGGPKFQANNAILIVFQLVAPLILLYAPHYCLILWEASTGSPQSQPKNKIHPVAYATASALLTCTPLFNGFLYGVRSKPLRKTFENYWRKKQTENEVHQEIQARTPSTCGGSRRQSLTPLGCLLKPSSIQRRLSEAALLDIRRPPPPSPLENVTRKTKINSTVVTHCTSSWRRLTSATALNLSPNENDDRLKHVNSCNTLRVPMQVDDGDKGPTLAVSVSPSSSIVDDASDFVFPDRKFDATDRSPTIKITRIFCPHDMKYGDDASRFDSKMSSLGKYVTSNKNRSSSSCETDDDDRKAVSHELTTKTFSTITLENDESQMPATAFTQPAEKAVLMVRAEDDDDDESENEENHLLLMNEEQFKRTTMSLNQVLTM